MTQNPFLQISDQLEAISNQLANQKPKQADEWLNADQAAEFLMLKKSTIYKKVHEKSVPYYKIGKNLKFSRNELTAFIKGGKVEQSMKPNNNGVYVED